MADISASICDTPLDVSGALAWAQDPSLGGIAAFVGTVRATGAVPGNETRRVVRLDYEAHPDLAPARLRAIAEEATTRWDVRRVVAIHRTGSCVPGEPAVVVVCAAPRRADALDACRFVIEEIKATVPIFKREVYADGSSWVGAGS